MFRLDNVRKVYGDVVALDIVDCCIETDKFTCVLGPSGSGKSTLLRALSFLEAPTIGEVSLKIDGKCFNSASVEKPWPLVTCVFQKQFLWPHLSLRENIILPLRARGVDKKRKSKMEEVVDLFEMSEFIDRYPNEVSGGQAQRVALARALVIEPKIILIDEAHGGLDLEQQDVLNNHLMMLRKSGVGLIVVTHSLDFARRYSERVIVLDGGKIVDDGDNSVFNFPRSTFLKKIVNLD